MSEKKKLRKMAEIVDSGNMAMVEPIVARKQARLARRAERQEARANRTPEEKAERLAKIGNIIKSSGKALAAAGYGWQGIPYHDIEQIEADKTAAAAAEAEASRNENAANRAHSASLAEQRIEGQKAISAGNIEGQKAISAGNNASRELIARLSFSARKAAKQKEPGFNDPFFGDGATLVANDKPDRPKKLTVNPSAEMQVNFRPKGSKRVNNKPTVNPSTKYY